MRALEKFPRSAGLMDERSSPIRQVARRSNGPPGRRVDAKAKRRQSSSPRMIAHMQRHHMQRQSITSSLNDNRLPGGVEAPEEEIEAAEEEREASDLSDDIFERGSTRGYSQGERLQRQLFGQAGPDIQYPETTEEVYSLPSEQEAEEMMEKFLGGFTTLYDDDKDGKTTLEH